MFKFSTILDAVESQLNANLTLPRYMIQRNGYLNMDKRRNPWIGIYPGDVTHTAHTIGKSSSSWRTTGTIRLLVQEDDTKSAANAEAKVETAVDAVMTALLADYSLGGTVLMLGPAVGVAYTYREDESATTFYYMAELTVGFELRTGT